MVDSTRTMAVSMLILRIFAFTLLAASVAVLVTNKFTNSQDEKVTFDDVITYRYVVAAALIGVAYAMLQLPFTIYYACTEKRMFRNEFLQEFDFYGDKIISFILAAAVGSGLAVSYEGKRFLNGFFDVVVLFGLPFSQDDEDKTVKFLNRGMVATGLLGGGFVFMAVVSVLSSIHRTPPTKSFFFGK